jgi:hypothetical protein
MSPRRTPPAATPAQPPAATPEASPAATPRTTSRDGDQRRTRAAKMTQIKDKAQCSPTLESVPRATRVTMAGGAQPPSRRIRPPCGPGWTEATSDRHEPLGIRDGASTGSPHAQSSGEFFLRALVAHPRSHTNSVPVAAGGVRWGRFCVAAEKIGSGPERVARSSHAHRKWPNEAASGRVVSFAVPAPSRFFQRSRNGSGNAARVETAAHEPPPDTACRDPLRTARAATPAHRAPPAAPPGHRAATVTPAVRSSSCSRQAGNTPIARAASQ